MASLNATGALERLSHFLRKAAKPASEAAALIPSLPQPAMTASGFPIPKIPRIMALDVGRRYIGVAVADPSTETAVPLAVLDRLRPEVAATLPPRAARAPLNDPELRARGPADFKSSAALAQEVAALRLKHNIVATVVGMPNARTFDDKDVPRFIMDLTARLRVDGAFAPGVDPAFDALFWSEHLSTSEAKARMRGAGIVGYMAQKRAGLDKEAAAVILSDFLAELNVVSLLADADAVGAQDTDAERAAAESAAARSAGARALSSRRDLGLPIGRGFSDAEFERAMLTGQLDLPPELLARGLTPAEAEAEVRAHVARNLFFLGAQGQVFAFDTALPVLRAANARLADWQYYAEYLQRERPQQWARLSAADRALASRKAEQRRAELAARDAAAARALALTPPTTMALVHRTGVRSASAVDAFPAAALDRGGSSDVATTTQRASRELLLPKHLYTPVQESIDFALAVAAGAPPAALAAEVRAARAAHGQQTEAARAARAQQLLLQQQQQQQQQQLEQPCEGQEQHAALVRQLAERRRRLRGEAEVGSASADSSAASSAGSDSVTGSGSGSDNPSAGSGSGSGVETEAEGAASLAAPLAPPSRHAAATTAAAHVSASSAVGHSLSHGSGGSSGGASVRVAPYASPALAYLLTHAPHLGARASRRDAVLRDASPAVQLGPAGGVDSVLGGVGKPIFSPAAAGERWVEAEEAAAAVRARLRAAVADAAAVAAMKQRKRNRRARAAAGEGDGYDDDDDDGYGAAEGGAAYRG